MQAKTTQYEQFSYHISNECKGQIVNPIYFEQHMENFIPKRLDH